MMQFKFKGVIGSCSKAAWFARQLQALAGLAHWVLQRYVWFTSTFSQAHGRFRLVGPTSAQPIHFFISVHDLQCASVVLARAWPARYAHFSRICGAWPADHFCTAWARPKGSSGQPIISSLHLESLVRLKSGNQSGPKRLRILQAAHLTMLYDFNLMKISKYTS